ncbi:metallophosphoesterase [Paraburkholderia fungorum]|uniref:metallophosphoesterase n=1 Tax=Paraburkholderia fungorum TaxID=134537 RepID=UPI0038BB54DC
MRLQIASDLHLEKLAWKVKFGGLAPAQADVLVLAGDIHRGSRAVREFASWPTPVIYVLGNHEFYGGQIGDVEAQSKAESRGGSVVVLAQDEIIMAGVRFLGCTLWTDFRLNHAHRKAMAEATDKADHQCIFARDGTAFSPENSVREHISSLNWLDERLRSRFAGRTVVVTHHAPHARSLDERVRRSLSAASFASDLSHLIPYSSLWIHGHVHSSLDYRQGGRKVLCNPRGQPRFEEGGANLYGSNRHFRPDFIYSLN